MRVALLNLAFDPDLPDEEALAERFGSLGRFARELQAAGIDVAVLQRFRRDRDLVLEGVDWRFRADDPRKPFAGPRARPVELFRIASSLDPDVVHVNGLMFPLAVAELRLRLPRRSAVVVQHHAGGPATGLLGTEQRLLRRAVDAFLFTAAPAADPFRRSGAIAADQRVLELLEASSDFLPLPRDASRAASGVRGAPAILWVGRLHERKDPLTAFRAVDAFLESAPGARLFAAFGEAPLLPEVQSLLARSPRLAERTALLGRVPHERLEELYSAADLFLTSSPDEGSNWALIEALACGTAVVASDIPVHRSVVAGFPGAAFFEVGNAAGGAAALGEAWSRLAGRIDASRVEIRQAFDERLSWRAVATAALSAYREVSRGGRAPG